MNKLTPPASRGNSSSEESTWTQEKTVNIPIPATEEKKVLTDHEQERGQDELQNLLDLDEESILTKSAYLIEKLNTANLPVFPVILFRRGTGECTKEQGVGPSACLRKDFPSARQRGSRMADLEYVKFCVEMSEKIKWIEDEAALLRDQRMRNELVAYFQSLKTALQFRNISGRSVLSGFEEHLASLRFDFNPHKKDLVSVYVELWKRVAKKKVNLGEALRQLYEDDIFPSRKALIKYALDSYPDISLIKYDYDTYVDGIDKKLPEDEARPLIMEAVKKMVSSELLFVAQFCLQQRRDHCPTP
ncbi:hypothetical protein ZWY2020_027599 [Hordeum vulgare]|nr:hypothetical protein ZWY2020_027599 [Hordeum vulgare]